MPVIVPQPIIYTAIDAQGNIIGLQKIILMYPGFTTIPLTTTKMSFTEQMFIADSKALDDPLSKTEAPLISDTTSNAISESPSKAETVIITNT